MARSFVKDIDKGWDNLVRQVSIFHSHDIIVGWLAGDEDDQRTANSEAEKSSPITNARLALVHEYGTNDGKIPAGRLGFREWFDRRQAEIKKRISEGIRDTMRNGGAIRNLNKIGLWATADWKKYLRDVQPGPEWSDSTDREKVRRHGFRKAFRSKKLIDTGQLINGITYVVERRGAFERQDFRKDGKASLGKTKGRLSRSQLRASRKARSSRSRKGKR